MRSVDPSHVEVEGDSAGSEGGGGALVVGPADWAVAEATTQLRSAGWKVHHCCDSAEAPFPCNALMPGRGCPLDHQRVDVVVVVRPRPRGEPALSEMGAICGLRSGIPLVAAGGPQINGFGPWATSVPEKGDIVTSCNEVLRVNH